MFQIVRRTWRGAVIVLAVAWVSGAVVTTSGAVAARRPGARAPRGRPGTVRRIETPDLGPSAAHALAWGTCSSETKLLSNSGRTDDAFGWAVAGSGNTLVVGAPFDTKAGGDDEAGAAHVFVRSGDTWSSEATLRASDGAFRDWLGTAVAVSGDTAVVGANNCTTPEAMQAGAAYVFVRVGSTWTEQAKLEAADGTSLAQFGLAVAVSGDTAVIGAMSDDPAAGADAGAAYVFVRTGTTWSQQAKLLASDGASGAGFGEAVWASGDTVLVGAPNDDTAGGVDAGAAYVYVRTGTTWTEEAKLTSPTGAAGDHFGFSLSLSGDTVVAAAYADDTPSGPDAGSADVFVRSGGTWTWQGALAASDAAGDDKFGCAVAVEGDVIVVGAYTDVVGGRVDAGSAYVFVREGSSWREEAKLTASDTEGIFFGLAVAIAGDSIAAGSLVRIGGGPLAPRVYVYGNCDADADGLDDAVDNCPMAPNPLQENADGDALGDACDPCPADPTNADADGDGACDDGDGSGVAGDAPCAGAPAGCDDNCPSVANAGQADADGDGAGDACDPCPADPTNADADGDGACDDGDGSGVAGDAPCAGAPAGCDDNCPSAANAGQADADGDGEGDACDPCPSDPADTCDDVNLLRNGDPTTLSFAPYRGILTAGRDPRLDPARDLEVAAIESMPSVTVAGDGAPVGVGNPGVIVFYEVTNGVGPLRVARDGSNVVLSGW